MSVCRVGRQKTGYGYSDILSTNELDNLLDLAQPDTGTGRRHMYVNTSKTTHAMKYIKG